MATTLGRTNPSVADFLLSAPWDFDFFQAVRLMAALHPTRRLLSGFRQPPEETVRFHAHQSLLFAASAIQSITQDSRENGPLHVTVNFMGLTGPQGILPEHYTEYLLARANAHDTAADAFFDLFNHRLISLFYLAWEKHHFPAEYERHSHSGGSSGRLSRYVFDLIGMGTPGLKDHLGFTDAALLFYSGLIAQRPRSATALAGLLRDYFQVPVEVDQFVGQWCRLGSDDLSYLAREGAYNQLGSGAIVGEQVWNQQARFRIRVGPLDWQSFDSFMPGGAAFRRLIDSARYFTDETRDFEVQLVLLAAEVHSTRLGDGPGSARLGYSSWLKTAPFAEDAHDLILPVRSSPDRRKEASSTV